MYSILATLTLLFCLTQAQDQTTQEAITTTTTIPPFSLNLAHVESSTDSIEVEWSIHSAYTVGHFHIEAVKVDDDDSDGTMVSPDNPSNTSTYIVTDLMTNSPYKICMLAEEVQNVVDEQSVKPYEECIDTETIPVIRTDSVLALIIVFGYLLLMILIGYVCWRCAHAKAEREAAAEEEVEETKTNGDQSQPILMVSPPAGEKPKSGIEDRDIPYITPTWDELAKEKKEGK